MKWGFLAVRDSSGVLFKVVFLEDLILQGRKPQCYAKQEAEEGIFQVLDQLELHGKVQSQLPVLEKKLHI